MLDSIYLTQIQIKISFHQTINCKDHISALLIIFSDDDAMNMMKFCQFIIKLDLSRELNIDHWKCGMFYKLLKHQKYDFNKYYVSI